MAGHVVGRAYRPGSGVCLVESEPDHPDHFTLRSMSGETFFVHRSHVQWRK